MMKRVIAAAVLLGLAASTPALAGEDIKALSAEAKGIVQGFFKELKGTLVGAMKAKGPVGAVNTCNVKAAEIASKHAEQSGWEVGRTALKLRNPANEPDEWEKAVLEEFAKKIAAGADPMKLAKAEIVEQDGKKVFRFMKAIPTGKPCLTCHGENVKPEVLKTIKSHYPDDQATGFKLGELRGAFTLKKVLP